MPVGLPHTRTPRLAHHICSTVRFCLPPAARRCNACVALPAPGITCPPYSTLPLYCAATPTAAHCCAAGGVVVMMYTVRSDNLVDSDMAQLDVDGGGLFTHLPRDIAHHLPPPPPLCRLYPPDCWLAACCHHHFVQPSPGSWTRTHTHAFSYHLALLATALPYRWRCTGAAAARRATFRHAFPPCPLLYGHIIGRLTPGLVRRTPPATPPAYFTFCRFTLTPAPATYAISHRAGITRQRRPQTRRFTACVTAAPHPACTRLRRERCRSPAYCAFPAPVVLLRPVRWQNFTRVARYVRAAAPVARRAATYPY